MLQTNKVLYGSKKPLSSLYLVGETDLILI